MPYRIDKESSFRWNFPLLGCLHLPQAENLLWDMQTRWAWDVARAKSW